MTKMTVAVKPATNASAFDTALNAFYTDLKPTDVVIYAGAKVARSWLSMLDVAVPIAIERDAATEADQELLHNLADGWFAKPFTAWSTIGAKDDDQSWRTLGVIADVLGLPDKAVQDVLKAQDACLSAKLR